MNKTISILLIGVLVLSGLGASAINIEKDTNIIEKEENANGGNRDFTHTVFGEYGTATWCGYCKYAHGALKELFAEGQLDFYYVSLVCDKNPTAYARADIDYNLYGYPTLWWDGGFDVDVGAGSVPAAKATYTTSINSCGSRTVEDVDIDLTATWLGGTEFQVDATVTNNEATTYGGHVRVYITERISSMGWYDTAGDLYTFPFLDWAFNEPLSIPAGGSWSNSMTWDGASHGYSSITEGNTVILAAVFNDEWHQGYSYPPSSNPFDAYWVDESTAFMFSYPPNTPTITGPTSGIHGVEYDFTVSTTDPDEDDLYFYIDWGDGTYQDWDGPYASGEDVIFSNSWEDGGTFDVKVKAKDTADLESGWSDVLTIEISGNIAPDTPTIEGPTSGKVGAELLFTFTATDPEENDLYYYIDWGDNTSEEWIGPYSSGDDFTKTHSWDEKETYTIRAKAKDTEGAESDWGTLDISVPVNQQIIDFPLLQLIFERFPNAFPILRLFLGL